MENNGTHHVWRRKAAAENLQQTVKTANQKPKEYALQLSKIGPAISLARGTKDVPLTVLNREGRWHSNAPRRYCRSFVEDLIAMSQKLADTKRTWQKQPGVGNEWGSSVPTS